MLLFESGLKKHFTDEIVIKGAKNEAEAFETFVCYSGYAFVSCLNQRRLKLIRAFHKPSA